MAITSLVMRISGTVTYEDGSHAPFEASYGSADTPLRDLVAQPDSAVALEAFAQFITSSLTGRIEEVLAFLPSMVAIIPGTPAASKTVSDATLFLTGAIAEDDRTKSSFAIEYNKMAIDHFPSATDAVWAKLAADPVFNAAAASLVDAVAGEGVTMIASS